MQHFTKIDVWRRSHELTLEVYKLTARFPKDELYGVTSQPRRAMVSVPTNIAEGAMRRTNKEYARFLNISEGSLAESEYLLMLSRDLGYLTDDIATLRLDEVGTVARMLKALRRTVENAR